MTVRWSYGEVVWLDPGPGIHWSYGEVYGYQAPAQEVHSYYLYSGYSHLIREIRNRPFNFKKRK